MIVLLLAASIGAGLPQKPALRIVSPPPARCAPEGLTLAQDPASLLRPQDRIGARKLGDLPRANLMLPVLRHVDGCPVPTVIRYGVEGNGRFGH